MGANRDLVPLVEAAYRIERTAAEWVRGLATAAMPALDRGAGLHVFRIERDGNRLRPVDPVCVGAAPSWAEAWRETWWDRWIAPLDQPSLASAISFGACSYATQLWAAMAEQIPTYADFLARLANDGFHHVLPTFAGGATQGSPRPFYPDSFNLVAVDTRGSATVILANLTTPARSVLTPEDVARWERVAAHIAAGDRLRRRASRARSGEDAVLAPGGKLLHAEGDARAPDARAALRDAARRVDAARKQTARGAPEDVLELWQALYDGRWSVFDRFDSDGRRFLVARRNPQPDGPQLTALTTRQRQVATLVAMGHSNKAVAYELGIATPTVASLVRGVKQRLGASSRAELVRALRAVERD